MRFVCATLPWLLWMSLGWAQVPGENPLQAQGQLVPIQIAPQQGAELRIRLKLPAKYHAYSENFSLKPHEESGFQVGGFKIEPQAEFYDENSKKKRKGITGEAVLTAPIEAPRELRNEKNPAIFRLTYQACTKTYCLLPLTIDVPVEFTVAAETADTPTTKAPRSWSQLFNTPLAELLGGESLALSFLIIFIAGFLTSLTPCVFPMIPITLAVLGRSAHARSKTQNLAVSLVYVLGLALTYSALGIFAASTGVLFGSFMNSPWILGFVCLVFLAMSLSMFGLYDLDFPELQNKLGHIQLQGYPGALFTGMIAGVVAGPCVGPVLVGILTYVAQTKNMWIGFWALFTFAVGMGVLFIALGISSSATKLLPKSGAWMDGVKHFFGLMMLFAFYYYLRLLVSPRVFDGAIGLGAILLGSLKGAFETPPLTSWGKVRKGLCQAIILIGAAYMVIALFDLRPIVSPRVISEQTPVASVEDWQPYSDALMAKAAAEGKPVILDFFADWCAACKELEQYTFNSPAFKEKSKGFVLMRFDATNESPQMETLKKKYDIVGLPTVVFHDAKGNWLKELTLTAFEETPEFLHRVEKTRDAR